MKARGKRPNANAAILEGTGDRGRDRHHCGCPGVKMGQQKQCSISVSGLLQRLCLPSCGDSEAEDDGDLLLGGTLKAG